MAGFYTNLTGRPSSLLHSKTAIEQAQLESENLLPVRVYLLEKIARHGVAVTRLRAELDTGSGEFAGNDFLNALAFDSADYVWAYLCISGFDQAQESRQLRNHVAQEIHKVFSRYEWLTTRNEE